MKLKALGLALFVTVATLFAAGCAADAEPDPSPESTKVPTVDTASTVSTEAITCSACNNYCAANGFNSPFCKVCRGNCIQGR